MKLLKILILALLFVSSSVSSKASDKPRLGHVVFGSNYIDAVNAIHQDFGIPDKEDSLVVEYFNKEYFGTTFDKVIFTFKNSVLYDARFVSYKSSKYAANQSVRKFAENFKHGYSLSMDIDDDGTYFYKGGRAKSIDGRLFTLFIRKFSGRWSMQMRYGPYKL